jgi:hypothetical protein
LGATSKLLVYLSRQKSAQIPKSTDRFIVRRFHAAYLRHYFDLHPGGEKEYHHWLPVVAAARFCENIPEIQQWLLKQVETILIYPYGE